MINQIQVNILDTLQTAMREMYTLVHVHVDAKWALSLLLGMANTLTVEGIT